MSLVVGIDWRRSTPEQKISPRRRELLGQLGVPFDDATRQVRARSVFTTHTPVPAGHDTFTFADLARCSGDVWSDLGVSRETFFEIGTHPTEEPGRFHMTVAALRLSKHVNAVSRRHGDVSRQIWASLWPDRDASRVPIGHITNGVHL